MKQLAIGILAHVDAGKTTLSEAMLYESGAIREVGRVDHGDTHLDTDVMERERGITIFSKQARLQVGDLSATLLDTPGHADLSAEMERTLQVLDYAILVVSGTDGVQAHTETLKGLLARYRIPTFIFVTKMDMPLADREAVLADLHRAFGEACVDLSRPDAQWAEAAALLSEPALEEYLAAGSLSDDTVRELIAQRRLFPCFFGSGLRLAGIKEFLAALDRFTRMPAYPQEFSARVYKVMRGEGGVRLSCLKVTGGSLRLRAAISYLPQDARQPVTEKVSGIRLYSGAKFTAAEEVPAGGVCAVAGLSATYPGQTLGGEGKGWRPAIQPVLLYRITLPPEVSPREMLPRLKELEEEDPQLHIEWAEETGEIRVQLMGEVQQEILRRMVEERCGVSIGIDQGRILYRETIADAVEGVGHFEPLRHYAEVHLLLEPGERGSGLVLASDCSEDRLDKNWQRLILTHLAEKQHRGVLIGAPLTDVRITLLAGRAHVKHTEGGDFRQATYRAVRQGLMQAESVLLEPVYRFRLRVPTEQVGRAISDIRQMAGTPEPPQTEGEFSLLEGRAPVATMHDYQKALLAYTRGRGRLSCAVEGYAPAHNAAEVIARAGYDPARDTDNPADSVFCSHGSGVIVPWDKVREHMHIDTGFGRPEPLPDVLRRRDIDEKELSAIMEREFGPIRRPLYRRPDTPRPQENAPAAPPRRERLFVDGYNVIFAWDELKDLAGAGQIEGARRALMDILDNYAGYTGAELVLVFDGYRVGNNPGERFGYHNIHVVYTREGESADVYIERRLAEIGKNESVRLVTSDHLIQLTAWRIGLRRTGAREFRREVAAIGREIEAILEKHNAGRATTRIKLPVPPEET